MPTFGRMRGRGRRGSFRRRGAKRIFWVRTTGTLIASQAATGAHVALVDPLTLLPDSAGQRSDTRDITIHRIKFNLHGNFQTVVGGGTATRASIYNGIYIADRDIGAVRLASFSGATDARTDWMWAMFDHVNGIGTAGTTVENLTSTSYQASEHDIKAKRRMQSNDLLHFSTAVFPFAGTLPGSYNMQYQWQCSVLFTVS